MANGAGTKVTSYSKYSMERERIMWRRIEGVPGLSESGNCWLSQHAPGRLCERARKLNKKSQRYG
jgi:hypothetical protein